MEVLLQQIINGLVLGSMYALVALGYTMVYGIINLINFAHGEVLMVGALTSWTSIGWMKDAMPGAPGWVILLLATLIAMVVCGKRAAALGRPLLGEFDAVEGDFLEGAAVVIGHHQNLAHGSSGIWERWESPLGNRSIRSRGLRRAAWPAARPRP